MSYYMGGEGRRLHGQTTPSELRDKFMMSVRMPVGVVGAITPWNFPIAIPSWKLCPALVCGNTVVLKPAEDTPLLAERFVELLAEAGVPPGVVNVVHGYGEEAGDALVRHPDVPVITFTGSRETGVAVTKAAADHLKHVHLELGGKNAIIVMDDADVDLAVEGIVWSAFGTSGQRCTAASRVIVHEAVYGELQSKLVAAAERLRLGPGWEDDDRRRPADQPRRARQGARLHARSASDEGAKLLTGGEAVERRAASTTGRPCSRDVEAGHADRAGGDLRPDDRADPGQGLRRGGRRRELGPATASRRRSSRATSTAPSARCATCRPGSRTSTRARPAPRCTCRSAASKETGNGHREAGQAALDVFTEWKSIYVDYSGKLQRRRSTTRERHAGR